MKYLKGLESRMFRFDECVKIVGMKRTKGLRLDVCTRWNATYDMINNVMRYRFVLNRLAEEDANFKHCSPKDEWNRVERITRFLKPFNDITTLFSRTDYPTANLYFQGIVVLACAIVLDPRYKLDYVDFILKKIEPIEHIAEMKVESIETTLYKLFSEYECPKPMATTNVSSCVGSSSHTSGAVDDPDDDEDKEDDVSELHFVGFSTRKEILTPYRSCLLPENVEATFYSKSWLYRFEDENADEIGQLELQFASMNICSAEFATNVE
ncbi:zinc finger BED domain-containing protein RICESLEEPER 2-like [Quercus robur]|uniref:zinc finger BED domain-containing protein RICESLEEPER 2-like n=1 Tax=Quercus robur TaxID=38942 RepID=UPI0021633D13|nr:zinc finger BED domain-containing protein RICESLEEPER 2-like [Quercus robur]